VAKTRIRLTAPYPTVDDVVKTFRIPPSRVKKVLSMVDEILAKLDREKASRVTKAKLRRSRRSKHS
jgi:hypothetical protein